MSVLDELEKRAGASSTDREAWLRTRLGGVTATEVRDLMVKGAAYRRDLLAVKRGERADTFTGNQYTRWGKEREPALMEVAARHGIAPESRVFHAADNARFLASPDGVGVDFDGNLVVAECKTSSRPVGTRDPYFAECGYWWQMQWQMHVTGASRCLYVWEQHEEFRPVALDKEWVARDEDAIAELVALATGFLADLDSSLDAAADPVRDARLLELIEARDTARAHAAALDEELRDFIEEHGIDAVEVGGWSVTYSIPKPRRSFDSKAFKAAHGGLYEEFMREGEPGKPVLRVTKKKETKDG